MDELRKLLNIPDGIRIGQHIYNANRDLEHGHNFESFTNGEISMSSLSRGIDIFNISDKEFIRKVSEFNYE